MTTAAIFGLISGSTLFIGALLGMYLKVSKYAIGAIMAFGSGVLISALTFDLMENAFLSGGFDSASIGFIAGTLLFVIGDYLIDHLGGHFRKRRHGKIHTNKTDQKNDVNSGSAILLGAVLDGIPESLAIGIGLAAGQGVGFSMMIAVFISNFPEGISGAQGMKVAGKSNIYILSVWGITIATSVCAAVLGYAFLGNASKDVIAITLSLAAGAILAMIADTMMPEAFEEGGRFIALATASGFFLAFVVSHLAS
ncbi:ZIP family zinc transporter [Acetobacterium paludosum]|uniref:ZIP family zinc transporter n=1 Tax=Acetobacterium paludosum TaxID=52693 RepID=A0A923KYL0_9FIRM|nr:ZIP family zinc transporter [Acetobacterium paludosum]MBC3889806.1 ZIP family zinc transporter [Acetobacterium paludosum]